MKISPIALGLCGENNLLPLQRALPESDELLFSSHTTRPDRPPIALR